MSAFYVWSDLWCVCVCFAAVWLVAVSRKRWAFPALVALVGVGVAGPVQAEGSLRPDDMVAWGYDPDNTNRYLIQRANLAAPGDVETAVTIDLTGIDGGIEILAIKDKNTLLVQEYRYTDWPERELNLQLLDIRSGARTTIATLDDDEGPAFGNRMLDRDGNLIGATIIRENVNAPVTGTRFMRFDTTTFELEAVASVPLRLYSIATDGIVFYAQMYSLELPYEWGLYRITPGETEADAQIDLLLQSDGCLASAHAVKVIPSTSDLLATVTTPVPTELVYANYPPEWIAYALETLGETIPMCVWHHVDPDTLEVTPFSLYEYQDADYADPAARLFSDFFIDSSGNVVWADEFPTFSHFGHGSSFYRAACADGFDNDGDGLADLDDPHCDSLAEDVETSGCTDGIDNDLDGLVDLADADDCPDHLSDGEIPLCADGIDNDGDGVADRFDPECANALDDSEAPECSDGVDNNGNGLVDVAEDWLVCSSAEQACEGYAQDCPQPQPACNDGWDNDGDGFVDVEDPDCIGNAATISELPACGDGVDNDNDGFFDLADADCDELTGKGELAQCNDGIDNDGDGLVDYPNDPDCKGIDDDQELSECADGVDNDGDGLIDVGADLDCVDAEDDVEETRQCSDGIDNDGDGFIDYLDDPQCNGNANRDSEAPKPGCSAGPIDGSPWSMLVVLCGLLVACRRRARSQARVLLVLWLGLIAVPVPATADGSLRPGEMVANSVTANHTHLIRADVSVSPPDTETIMADSSTSPFRVVVGDHNTVFLVDYVTSAIKRLSKVDVRSGERTTMAEFSALGGVDVEDLALGFDGHPLILRRRHADTGGGQPWYAEVVRIDRETFEQDVIVHGENIAETRFLHVGVEGELFLQSCRTAPMSEHQTLRVTPVNPNEDPIVEVLYESPPTPGPWSPSGITSCNGIEVDPDTREVVVTSRVDVEVEDFLQGYPQATIDLWIQTFGHNAQEIGLVGIDPTTSSARTVVGVHAIWLGGGSWFNGGFGARYAIESSGTVLMGVGRVDPVAMSTEPFLTDGGSPFDLFRSACRDGIDNDGDGLADMDDPHCDSPDEDRETSGCTDGIDNDNDGLIDLADTDCPNHLSDGEIPLCADGIDNDGDGLVDRFDPECANAFDDSEPVECSDGIDNNGNGLVDVTEDWLVCTSASQACEGYSHECPQPLPACSDGWDNDGDGYFDTEDPDCIGNPATISELPACGDGVDNDDDGVFDLADEDCDDLTGKGELSQCNDGVDNDGDGFVDFGDDPDCKSIDDNQELAECSDLVDNDEDGLTDANDPDCVDADDDVEATRQCSDGIDNDGDGLIDHQDDPQCNDDPNRDSERPASACSAGPLDGSPWATLVVLVALLAMRRRRAATGRALAAVLVVAAAMSVGGVASADGSLRVDDYVYNQVCVNSILRANRNAPTDVEFVTSFPTSACSPRPIAILDKNTLLTTSYDAPSSTAYWKVDVRSGEKEYLTSLDIVWNFVRDPAGQLIGVSSELVPQPGGGIGPDSFELHIIDKDTFETTEFASLPNYIQAINFGRDGQLYAVLRSLWPEVPYQYNLHRIDLSGSGNHELLVPLGQQCAVGWHGLNTDPHAGGYFVTAPVDVPIEIAFASWDPFLIELARQQTGDFVDVCVWHDFDPATGELSPFSLYEFTDEDFDVASGRTSDPFFVDALGDLVWYGDPSFPKGPVYLPACADGMDNDGDGLVDMDDPHCDDPLEELETSGCTDEIDNDLDGLTDLADTDDCPDHLSDGEIPLCADGKDNDGDGLTDRFDPQCANALDDSEPAECSDGIDNNGNGLVDVAEDWLVCASASQACEGYSHECPQSLPACSDGWDNDGDGYFDTEDPDCIGNPATISELPACGDGIDNDLDGDFDLADDDCNDLTGKGELSQCNDGIDNDGDGLVDLGDDPDCSSINDDQELAQCADLFDNDGDGNFDLEDPDCIDATDDDEATRQCSDGIDNDGDGLVDYQDDPQCNDDPNQDRETPKPACSAGPMGGSPVGALLAILGMLGLRRRRTSRRAAAGAIFGFFALCVGTTAHADGPLRPGEVVVPFLHGGAIGQVGDEWVQLVRVYVDSSPPDAESIVNLDGSVVSLAIGDRNTVYIHRHDYSIWSVDVRSGDTTQMAIFTSPETVGHLTLGHDGHPLVLVKSGTPKSGRLVRIDKETFAQTEVMASTHFWNAGPVVVGVDGDVYMTLSHFPQPNDVSLVRAVPNGSSEPTFEVVLQNPGYVDIDPGSGLLTSSAGNELFTIDPETGAFASTGVTFEPFLGFYSVLFELDQNGNALATPFGGIWRPQPNGEPAELLFGTSCLGIQCIAVPGTYLLDFEPYRSACADGVDNDGDGLVDMDDPHCDDPTEERETSGCTDGVDNDLDGLTDLADADCPDHLSDGEIPSCADEKDNDGDGLIDRFDPQCANALDNSEPAECSDGIDNNGNGLVDVTEDWLVCASASQACEGYSHECPQSLPACSDGWDNDGDGYVDTEDPDCIGNPATLSELPACADGVDNDDDGVFDLADDDCDELTGTGELSRCNDGIDNDGDGLVDFGDDPDCTSIKDDRETAECSDFLDNDGDGLIDTDDPDCVDGDDNVEATRQCSDGIDNDGDGLVDYQDDPQCNDNPNQDRETPKSACSAGPMDGSPWAALCLFLGFVLCRRRLGRLFGAMSIALLASANPAQAQGPLHVGDVLVAYSYSNNNGQLAGWTTDYRGSVLRFDADLQDTEFAYVGTGNTWVIDLAIADANTIYVLENIFDGNPWPNRSLLGAQLSKVDVRSLGAEHLATFWYGSNQDYNHLYDLVAVGVAVGPNGEPMVLRQQTSPAHGDVLHVDPETLEQTTIASGPEFARFTAMENNLVTSPDGTLRFIGGAQPASPDSLLMEVDPSTGMVTSAPVPSVNFDGFDSVASSIIMNVEGAEIVGGFHHFSPFGWSGVGLESATQYIEAVWPEGPYTIHAFNFQATPAGPESWTLGVEADLYLASVGSIDRVAIDAENTSLASRYLWPPGYPAQSPYVRMPDVEVFRPACLDGVDNDGDGLVDMDDPHCDDPTETLETSGCTDGIDNDNDGLTDLADADCPDHLSDGEIPSCADGVDNDGDGFADRFDPHCANAFDNSEPAECSDGIDNNGNGLVDATEDWLVCASASQACEGYSHECPQALPACSDGWDNDGDGYFDTEDPDCIGNPATISELPACGDGVDNDDDGAFDLADSDCDDLTGTGELSQCNDGVDNDGDGLADFPDDPDCADINDDQELAECSDFIDNDNDGLTDTNDPDCVNAEDDVEATRQCSDGIDNDGDGLVDYADDPQCNDDPNRDSETPKSACSAGPMNGSPWATVVFVLALVALRRRGSIGRDRRWRRRHARDRSLVVAVFVLAFALGVPAAYAEGGEGSGQFTALGTAPEANFFNGSMTTSVGIEVPPGRPNATPTLALSYSSGAGSSPFGYGWNLPLGTIERSTKHGRPRCLGWEQGDNHTREFVLSVAGGTMEIAYQGPDGANQDLHKYLPRVDESYLEAVVDTRNPIFDPTGNTWVVEDRSGMTYRFSIDRDGTSYPEARAFHKLDKLIDDDLVVGDCEFTSIWAMTQMEDANGNTVDIRYFKEHNAIYPDTISYGANPSAGLTEHPFEVRFVRAQRSAINAPVIEQSHRGVRERMEQYIHRVEVYYRPSLGSAYQLVRAYDLQHTVDPDTGRLLLTSVDDDATVHGDMLPAQSFDYATADFDHYSTMSSSVPGSYCHGTSAKCVNYTHSDNGITGTCRKLVDMNGDGFQDLITVATAGTGYCSSGSNWSVYLGSSNGFSGSYSISRTGDIQHMRDNSDDGVNPTRRDVWWDVFDITGDGVADFVNASGSTWTVQPGTCSSASYCWFGGGISWSSPTAFIQRSTKSGSNWTTNWRLLDINGDGRPDMMYGSSVYLNDGSGFVYAPDESVNVQTVSTDSGGSSTVTTDFFDFNGDGLPDRLVRSGGNIWVTLNTGRGYSETSPILLSGVGGGGVIRGTSGAPGGTGHSDTYADFADVNGDGLPDRVWNSGSQWWVQLNQGGTGLGSGHLWHGSLGPIRRDYQHTDVENDGGLNVRTHTWIDLLDFNGDGFIDRLNANGSVHLGGPSTGPEAKPLYLSAAHNGIGGTTTIDYSPSSIFNHTGADGVGDHDLPFSNWVVTQIARGDGISPDNVQTVHYADGLFDAVAREFRGFKTVTRTDVDGNQRITTYGQGDFDRGKVLVEEQYAGMQLMRRDSYEWGSRCLSPGTSCGQRNQVFLEEHKTEEFSLIGDSSLDRCVLNRNELPDDWGRVGKTCSLSCDDAPATPGSCANPIVGQVDTVTTWADPINNYHQRERPQSIQTSYVNAAGATELLSQKYFRYDVGGGPFAILGLNAGVEKGNLKSVRTDHSATVGAWVVNDYDAFGNIVRVRDSASDSGVLTGEGRVHESDFDTDTFSLYPTTERSPTTGGVVHATETVTDLRFGKPTQTTGENDEVSRVRYDGLGRVTCEARPGEDLSNCHTGTFTHAREYVYAYGDPDATDFESKLSYVEVRTREPNAPTGYLVAREYSDGVGRKRIKTGQTVVGASTTLSTLVVEHLDYDAAGRTDKSFVPYLLGGALQQLPTVAATTYNYQLNGGSNVDPHGRPHRVTSPDGNEVHHYFEGLRTRIITARGTPVAGERRSLEDDFGRVVRRELLDGEGGAVAQSFSTTYDGMGRSLTETVSDDVTTLVRHTYDLAGQETVLEDPDSGTWVFQYDLTGNVIYRDDPEPDQHVQWLFDEAGRLTHVCTFDIDTYVALSGSCGSGTEAHRYTYDSTSGGNAGLGKLTRVDDESGFEEIVYDARGRVTKRTRDVLGIEAVTDLTYDDADRVLEATYPDGESVDHIYNSAGRIKQIKSSAVYVSNIEYDFLGRTEKLVHGNGAEDLRGYHTAAANNFRLASIATSAGADTHLDLGYEYNALGKVSRITDQRDSDTQGTQALSNDNAYDYDGLGRLIDVDWLPGAGVGTHDDAFTYSSLGNITQKGGQTLAYDPVKPHQVISYGTKTFVHDDSGRRVQKGSGTDAQYYTYNALDQLTQIDFGNGDVVEYLYDYQGQRTAKRVNGDPWQRYFSDSFESGINDEGHGSVTKYYFAEGVRIAMRTFETDDFVDSAAATPIPFTIPSWFWALLALVVGVLLLNPGKREIRIGVAVGPARAMGSALLVVMVSGPALIGLSGCTKKTPIVQHYHLDHLGSTQVVTDKNGDIIHQVRYAPYGEIRGRFDKNGAAIGDTDTYRHEFTGYETEIESGLMYAGARYFDPELAQFLTHDPEEQYASPYAYGPGDPLNGTDPDGQFFTALIIGIALAAAGAIAAGVDAYLQTGSLTQAFKAAGISFGTSLAGLAISAGVGAVVGKALGAVLETTAGRFVAFSVKVGMAGHSMSGNIKNGNYASAAFDAFNIGMAAHGFAEGAGGEATSGAVSGGEETIDFSRTDRLYLADTSDEAALDWLGRTSNEARAGDAIGAAFETTANFVEGAANSVGNTNVGGVAGFFGKVLGPVKGGLEAAAAAFKGNYLESAALTGTMGFDAALMAGATSVSPVFGPPLAGTFILLDTMVGIGIDQPRLVTRGFLAVGNVLDNINQNAALGSAGAVSGIVP